MATVISTTAGLEAVHRGQSRLDWSPLSALRLYADYSADYAEMYRTQPGVRTVVDFLARNVAQLGLHVFRRSSNTDRERLADHPLARLIARPNASTSRYRFISSIMTDLTVYWNAYLLKVRPSVGPMMLLQVPPWAVHVKGRLSPTQYVVNFAARDLPTAEAMADSFLLEPSEVIHFRGDNLDSRVIGLSPLETLRRTLAEEAAAGDYREGLWRHGARMSGLIKRPLDAPEMSEIAQARFLAQWEAMYSGTSNSGKTAMLDEGMSFEKMTFTSEESQYIQARKLNLEQVARLYQIPAPMVNILDHANFSNVAEFRKMLYTECLGPWLVMLEDELQLQLVPEFQGTGDVYLEFNIAEKLKGAFEERAAAISSAVGRPWLTANEARALDNRNALDGDADQLVTPLNVLTGGQSSPRDSAPPPKALPATETKAADEIDATYVRLRARHVEKWQQVLTKFFERQGERVLSRAPKGLKAPTLAQLFDEARWNRELKADLLALNSATALVFARKVADAYGVEADPERMAAWLEQNATIAAEGINGTTADRLKTLLAEDEPRSAIADYFALAMAARAQQIARSKVTTTANFGAREGGKQAGVNKKTWKVNSANPRSSHADVNGETVAMDDAFSNGLHFPGDGAGGAAEDVANCECSLSFGR